MIKKFLTISTTALILAFGVQDASAATVSPEARSKPITITTSTADGSYKVAGKKRNRRGRRGNSGRNIGLGIGIGLGALALGAAAAQADDNSRFCRRVERRCARRYGWETGSWYDCVEDRNC
jgi:hypothetical protein